MSRRPAVITQADIARAIRAAKAAGAAEVIVEVNGGRIVVKLQSTGEPAPLDNGEEVVL